MKLNFLKYKTKAFLKNSVVVRASLPYRQANNIGIIFTVEDKSKHDQVKEFVRRLELEGKQVKVISFLPKNKDNYEFMFDFFTEKDINIWGNVKSETAVRFADLPFDYLFYLDTTPNPHLLNMLARSKARCRVGKYFPQGEPFFEFMLDTKDGVRSLIDSIHRYASRVH
jgi:hypothetical protein